MEIEYRQHLTGYDFNEHRHRYAVWTAARAVQRNFTKTPVIEAAINNTDLRRFSETVQTCTKMEFDAWHQKTGETLIDYFSINKPECSYGRASKIIAIYLKTSIILTGKGECGLAEIIHPPIDRILLSGIAQKYHLPELKTINWTELKKEAYWDLVDKLRSRCTHFDWRLEEEWKM